MNIKKIKLWLVALVGSLTLAWTFMTPIAGVADEAAYIVYADITSTGQSYDQAKIPSNILYIAPLTCFAFQPEVTANCQRESGWFEIGNEIVEVPEMGGISGYPVPYFWLVGHGINLDSGIGGLYAMRLIAWLLGFIQIALMVYFWPKSRINSLVFATLLVITPMVTSLMGSVNPNGFEIVSGLSLGGLISGLLLDPNKPKKILHLFAIFYSALNLSVAKPWSFLFTLGIFMAFLVAHLVTNRSENNQRKLVVTLSSLGIFAIFIGWISNSIYRDVMQDKGTSESVSSLVTASRRILGSASSYAFELVGILGWRDHAPQLYVLIFWTTALISTLVYAYMKLKFLLKIFLIGFVSIVIFILPILSSQALGLLGGAAYQSRYAGALFTVTGFLIIYYLSLSKFDFEASPIVQLLPNLLIVFTFLQLSSLTWSFLRYSVGLPLGDRDIPFAFNWTPDFAVLDLTFIIFTVISTVVLRKQLSKTQIAA